MGVGKIITIAGSDILAGGGVQADLATFNEYGLFGLSAITSIVTVNQADFDIYDVPVSVLAKQLTSLSQFTDIKGIKVGLLPSVDHIDLVSQFIKQYAGQVPVVIDPVMAFKETDSVNAAKLATAIKQKLLPLATVVTPNLIEAELLTEQSIRSGADLLTAAKMLHTMGPQTVVVKGGVRLLGDMAIDAVVSNNTEKIMQLPKISQPYNNGAGCTFSAAIASQISQDVPVITAIDDAKDFVHDGILHGVRLNDDFKVGNVWQAARRHKG